MFRLWQVLAAAAIVGATIVANVRAAEFVITPKAGSRVQFVSKAPMETFSGESRGVSGAVSLDPNALSDTIDVVVNVDMRSFDTGIDLRNKHMCENHLHCDKFPTATFRGGKLSNASGTSLAEGKTVKATIDGELELHGQKQPLSAPIELTLQKGSLNVVSRFKVKLPDFGIPRPQFLVMKLDEEQSVTVNLEARPK